MDDEQDGADGVRVPRGERGDREDGGALRRRRGRLRLRVRRPGLRPPRRTPSSTTTRRCARTPTHFLLAPGHEEPRDRAGRRRRPRLRRRREVRPGRDARSCGASTRARPSVALGSRRRRRRPRAGASTSSAGAGASIESAISALPPSRLRETAMFAMLTPASPKQRADAADHAGHVVVAQEDHAAARARSRARSRAPRRASGGRRCRSSCRRRATSSAVTATRFVKSRDDAALLLDDLDPALGGDERRVDVVDRLVGAALEGAVQRGDREQARVVLGELAVVLERRARARRRRRAPSRAGRASRRAGCTGRAPRGRRRRRSGC